MGIDRKAYRELEDIVGADFITEEPAVLDGYCFVWGNELIFNDKFSARPPAVIMPGNTEEVQSIIKICNKYNIKYKAHATGFEVVGLTADEPFIPIDLRRMNRIIEIDDKNRYAVVESYVSSNKLVVESRKKGLRPLVLGCGPSGSVLSGAACHFGSGMTNISTDYGSRTVLGVEWVLPDGEILRLGALGSGDGWFTGDGPGPSLRGIMRGYSGANGGLGVITKVAVKLYPWYGPATVKAKGKPPLYNWDIPENFAVHLVDFPSLEKANDFFHLITEESIAFSLMRIARGATIILATESNDALWELAELLPEEELNKLLFNVSYSVIVSFDASSRREMKYKEKCFTKILEISEGEMSPMFDDNLRGLFYCNAISAQGMVKITFRASGSFIVTPVADEAIDAMGLMLKKAHDEFHDEKVKAGKITGGGESEWFTIYGDIGAHAEVCTGYDPSDPESTQIARDIINISDKKIAEWSLGINSLEGGLSYKEASIKAALPYSLDFNKWMKKIKSAFDPNNVAESSFYVGIDE